VWSKQFEAVQSEFTRRLRDGRKLVHSHECAIYFDQKYAK
jgi:hypothetical protein